MEYNAQQFQAGQVLRASQLNAMDAAIKTTMKNTLPVTVEITKGTHSKLNIHMDGLEPYTQYVIQLYRNHISETSMDGLGSWYMMWNDQIGRSDCGYYTLAGKPRKIGQGVVESSFPSETPSWMTNNGILESRWFIDNGATPRYTFSINTPEWILDNLKPTDDEWEDVRQTETTDSYRYHKSVCRLIGTNKYSNKSLKFRVGILQADSNGGYQLVGLSNTVINVGARPNRNARRSDCSLIQINSEYKAANLWTKLTNR